MRITTPITPVTTHPFDNSIGNSVAWAIRYLNSALEKIEKGLDPQNDIERAERELRCRPKQP